jgi:gliding motility-associated-like protein
MSILKLKKHFQQIIFVLFIFNSVIGFSQNENNQWRFGNNNAVNFNPAIPTLITGSQCDTREGCASIADKATGALLFYTDGITVWDANDNPMTNGAGLLGWIDTASASSTASAVIVPKPNSTNLFYIITISGDSLPGNNGVYYSVLDMSLNGGLGDVVATQKNIFLYATESEKLSVVPSNTGCYWLLTTAYATTSSVNKFAAFNITATGVNTTAVESTFTSNSFDQIGHIKVNRQFDKIAIGESSGTKISLFDFNNTTGIVSNPITWNYNFVVAGVIYGLEFSPNGSKLYVSSTQTEVIQYNVSLANAAAIETSGIDVYNGIKSPHFAGAIQLGKNNKIYIRAKDAIDIINNPDVLGAACNYQEDYVVLPTDPISIYGLPQWIYYPTATNAIISSGTCLANPVNFSIQSTTNVIGVNWNFGDPASGANNTINTTTNPFSVQHTFSAAGTFTINAVVNYGCFTLPISRTVTINASITTVFAAFTNATRCQTGPSIQPLINTTSDNGVTGSWSPSTIDNSILGTTTYTFTPDSGQCATSFSFIITVNAIVSPTFSFATTFCTGAIFPTLPTTSDNGIAGTWSPTTITTAGNYTFTPNNPAQCGTSRTIAITIATAITPTFSFATSFCTGATFPALPTTSDNGIAGTWAPTTITGAGNYTFTPNNPAQCGTSRTIAITITTAINPTFSFATSFCTGAIFPTLPTTSDNGIAGTWSPTTITTAGNYTFTPNNPAQCGSVKTIVVTINPLINLSIKTNEIKQFQIENQNIEVSVLPIGNYIYSLDGGSFQPSNVFENVSSCNHSIVVKDLVGCSKDANISFFIWDYPHFFTPNGDGYNDYWNVFCNNYQPLKINIYDRFGLIVASFSSKKIGWDGKSNGVESLSDDYWFTINYTENGVEKIFKSHFALKR